MIIFVSQSVASQALLCFLSVYESEIKASLLLFYDLSNMRERESEREGGRERERVQLRLFNSNDDDDDDGDDNPHCSSLFLGVSFHFFILLLLPAICARIIKRVAGKVSQCIGDTFCCPGVM